MQIGLICSKTIYREIPPERILRGFTFVRWAEIHFRIVKKFEIVTGNGYNRGKEWKLTGKGV